MSGNKPISPIQPQGEKSDAINQWFGEFIDDIKTEHFLMSEGVAPKEKKKFYDDLISGNQTAVYSTVRVGSTMYFISNIIKDYLQELKTQNRLPNRLALGLSDSKILVWSEINDNDNDVEDALLIAEAKVNGKYHEYGFYLNSTIIEKSDNLSIPSHYQTIIG